MTTLEKIKQNIQTLPPEALNLLDQFIQLLQKTFLAEPPTLPIDEVASAPDAVDATDSEEKDDDWSDFIGCMSAEEDLSVNYKAYWGAGLEEKYGYR